MRAKSILGVAQTISGQAAAGRKQCEDAVTEARTLKDPFLLSQALLALAEAALNAGDAQAALNAASRRSNVSQTPVNMKANGVR